MIDFFRDRYGWTWLNKDLGAWRRVHPQLTKEIEDIKSRLDKLEKKLNKVVLSSNQVLIWDTLQSIGKKNSIEGFGKLFKN